MSSSRSRPTSTAIRCSTRIADDIAALTDLALARLSVDDRRLRRPRRRLGRRDLGAAPDRRARPAPGRRRSGLARPVATARRAGAHLPPRRRSTAPAAAPSTRCAPAPRGGSTSRARSSRASMSTTSRACCVASIARPRPGAVYNVCDDEPAAPEAVDRPCRRAARRAAAAARAVRRGRRCRRWRAASTPTTSGSRTR